LRAFANARKNIRYQPGLLLLHNHIASEDSWVAALRLLCSSPYSSFSFRDASLRDCHYNAKIGRPPY
jgi:hypothetical protein